jgi:rhodanese-related sulfurtransferase
MGAERISADEVRRKQLAGEPMLLVEVCDAPSYECLHLEGAVPLDKLGAPLGKGHEIVFYAQEEAQAERQAVEYFEKGFVNVKVLDGGVAAWKRAGYPLSLGT